MLTIDGSEGEGGGQILRTALSLSIITSIPFRMTNIRYSRSNPGLHPQHLTAVKAAASISNAKVIGATQSSTTLTFSPMKIRSGRYRFPISTAGATTLVLQTLIYPLSQAQSASSIILTGGTHVPWAPQFHYLEMIWMHYLEQMGFSCSLQLLQTGFYPQGGGRIQATIRPAPQIEPLQLSPTGDLVNVFGISGVVNLPLSIANRQKRQTILRLQKIAPHLQIKTQSLPGPGKGTFILLGTARKAVDGNSNVIAGFSALGAPGKPAETVADEAVNDLLAYLSTAGSVDARLSDQLLLPAALATGPSTWTTPRITQHLMTNAAIIQEFLPTRITIEGESGEPGQISIIPHPYNTSIVVE